MKQNYHTPGPWHLIETEPGIDAEMDVFVTTPRYAGGKGLIARVVCADDAVLIAAAPDLLDLLYKTLPFIEDAINDPCYKPHVVKDLEKAIKSILTKLDGA